MKMENRRRKRKKKRKRKRRGSALTSGTHDGGHPLVEIVTLGSC